MSLPAGVYTFTNVQSNTTVRAYRKEETIFVASTMEFPGPFEQWEIAVATAGYTIKNVGLSASCKADAAAGNPVITANDDTVFQISKEDERSYVIKIANADLVWTVSAPVIPRGEIILEGAQGSDTQKFRVFPI